MKRVVTVLAVSIACFVAIPGVTAEGGKEVAVVNPCVVLTGADSHVLESGYHRITSMEDWTEIWQKHKGQKNGEKYNLYYDPLGLPLVDFARFMVIVIFQGSHWNSAGLKAVSISEQEDRIVFRFDDKSYQTVGSDADGGGKPVTVYGFFVVPRSAKPLILEEDVQRIIGEPPVWKERITFPKM